MRDFEGGGTELEIQARFAHCPACLSMHCRACLAIVDRLVRDFSLNLQLVPPLNFTLPIMMCRTSTVQLPSTKHTHANCSHSGRSVLSLLKSCPSSSGYSTTSSGVSRSSRATDPIRSALTAAAATAAAGAAPSTCQAHAHNQCRRSGQHCRRCSYSWRCLPFSCCGRMASWSSSVTSATVAFAAVRWPDRPAMPPWSLASLQPRS